MSSSPPQSLLKEMGVSPELEAVWAKHASNNPWLSTTPTSPASEEGSIHALSPPPRKKRSSSRPNTPVDNIQPGPRPTSATLGRIMESGQIGGVERSLDVDRVSLRIRVDEYNDHHRRALDVDEHKNAKPSAKRRLSTQRRGSDLRAKKDMERKAPRAVAADPSVATASSRPFLVSHERKGSSSSTSTVTGTLDSDYTHPASTVDDAYISISSSVYNASSLMSHARQSRSSSRLTDDADRTSFIDMFSPQAAHFDTNIYESHSPSRTPKPPLPTTPKPNFGARTSNIPTIKKHSVSLPVDLPPTTNYLQADARADLVRKSRKLTQMFGQPPGAGVMPHSTSPSSFLDMPSSPNRSRHFRGAVSVSESIEHPTRSINSERRHSTIDLDTRRPVSPPTSFMEFSDDEQDLPPRRTPSSPATRSLFEQMSPDEQEEELRRRKRDKLAKLHRFLGSRVPTNLVLGLQDPFDSLPPAPTPTENTDDKRVWLRRRRSSSVAAFGTWSDDHDRVKENLDDHEKAINVRRAQKMEKVFGVAPPQTLYHTRSGTTSNLELPRTTNTPILNKRSNSGQRTPPEPASYKRHNKKKDDRPTTADSTRPLLLTQDNEDDDNRRAPRSRSGSVVYSHYQHSLNSLVDIIDRDDRESLAELHEYLNTPTPTATPIATSVAERRSSIRSERRRSLPVRTSLTSLASEYSLAESISSPTVEVTDFQLRRRRAAKLTAFFGVDYRDLIHDVLDSIENGLIHERRRGTINPEEAEDLLRRLREIKTKRSGFS